MYKFTDPKRLMLMRSRIFNIRYYVENFIIVVRLN